MSKAPVDWAFGEVPVQSSKMDQVVVDHITPGLSVWSVQVHAFWDNSLGAGPIMSSVVHGWYPFHADKSVHNRLYLLAREVMDGSETTANLEVTLDSGATWSPAFPSATAGPVEWFGAGPGTLFEIWDVSTITGFQWIGIRRGSTVPTSFTTSYRLAIAGILYNLTFNPF